MNFKLFEIITYFVIYSILGWILESVFRSICERKLINTGFLHGPFCPIYGVGAIIMLLFLDSFKDTPVILFFISIIVLTLWEYIVGVFLEKAFKTKYWDYSNHKVNFQGRICLTNSLMWGVLGVVFVKYIHPFIEEKIQNVDIIQLKYVIYILGIIMIIDTIISIIKIKNIKNTLEKVDILSKEIREKLNQIKHANKEKSTSSTENVQKIVDDLKTKRRRIMIRLYRHVYRLKKAFPAINSNEITEVLNGKIEIIKKNKNDEKHLK